VPTLATLKREFIQKIGGDPPHVPLTLCWWSAYAASCCHLESRECLDALGERIGLLEWRRSSAGTAFRLGSMSCRGSRNGQTANSEPLAMKESLASMMWVEHSSVVLDCGWARSGIRHASGYRIPEDGGSRTTTTAVDGGGKRALADASLGSGARRKNE